jgi:imidazolonepropionase-like amidohydrolase
MGRVIFTGANLIDGDHPARPNATVVIEGEHVAGVSDAVPAELGPDDRVIDLQGRTLMPGMVSCHFHSCFRNLMPGGAPSLGLEHKPAVLALIGAQNLELALHCGVTSVVGSSVPYHIDASLRDSMSVGLIPGPRMLAGSHELSTTGDVIDAGNRFWHYELGNLGLVRVADGADGFRKLVREEIARGSDIVKVNGSFGHGASASDGTSSLTVAELEAMAEVAHERRKLVRIHAASRESILRAARAGFDVIDHADHMDAECIDAILAAGSHVTPSLFYSQRLLEMYDRFDPKDPACPVRSPFETVAQARARVDGIRREFDYTLRAMQNAHAAGVNIVAGDDYGTFLLHHGEYATELEVYVKLLGVPPLDVIRWATRNGAQLMGRGDDLGTIEPGKLADLLVVDGDPLADIRCLQDRGRIPLILKGGFFVKNELPEA